MISIIVSTRSFILLQQLKQNIAQTIGLPFEIIPVKNDQAQYGLCEAYNSGAAQSQYPYLCFVHEDVLFHTPNWGAALLKLLENRQIGLVGVAGGMYKPANISGWWDISDELIRKNILQHAPQKEVLLMNVNPFQETTADVVTLDGVFLCTRREVWKQFSFDQQHFRGFHFYDTDFCTQVFTKYRIVVTYEILLEHFSQGNANSKEWIENALIYHTKWRKTLPLYVQQCPQRKKIISEKIACLKMINRAKLANFPLKKLISHSFYYLRFPYVIIFFFSTSLKSLKNLLKS